jgi:hypothetical protein
MLIPLSIGIGIALVTYAIRVWPRVGFPDYGADAFFHLALADVIRTEHNRQNFARYFSIGEYNDYPLLLHYFLALIPKETLEKISGYISPTFEVLNAILLYCFSMYLTGSWQIGLVAWIFYIASPQLSLESLTLTPRLAGLFLFNFWVVAMIVGVNEGSYLWMALSVTGGVASFFMMRAQLPFLLVTGILISGVTGDVKFFVLEALVFGLSFIMNPPQFIRNFKSYWIMTYDAGRYWRFYGDDRDRLEGMYKKDGVVTYKRTIQIIRKEVQMLISYNPASWLMALAVIWQFATGAGGSANNILPSVNAWFMMAFVTFLLAERIPQLGQRGGDGYRQYPEFGALPGALIAGVVFSNLLKNGNAIICCVAATGLIVSIALTVRIATKGFKSKLKASFTYIRPELKAILGRIRTYPMGGVMCLPHTYNYSMIYFGNKRVVDIIERSRPYRQLHSTYIMKLLLPLDEYVRMFNLDYFFIDTSLPYWNRDTSALGEIVEREGQYVFVRIKPEIKQHIMDRAQV